MEGGEGEVAKRVEGGGGRGSKAGGRERKEFEKGGNREEGEKSAVEKRERA